MSRYTDRIRAHIRRLQPEDLADLREFQRRQFGPQALQLQEGHHHWLFTRNPYIEGTDPQLWIYRDKEGVVQGQQAGIPYLLQAGGKSWRASWGIDLAVSPRYRTRGVGAILSDEYVRTNMVTTAAGITDAARKSHRRAGWRDLGTIPLYARPLTREGIRAGFRESRTIGRVATAVGYPLLQILERLCLSLARWKRARLELVEQFDQRSDTVWERTSCYYPLLGRRDLEYLRWRFDTAPHPERYQRYYLYHRERLSGYAVICYGYRGDRPAAVLTDFLCPPDLQTALFALCIESCRVNGANDLHCAVLSPHLSARKMKLLGFIPLPMRSRFMALAGSEAAPIASLLANARMWFVTMADSDMEWMYFLT